MVVEGIEPEVRNLRKISSVNVYYRVRLIAMNDSLLPLIHQMFVLVLNLVCIDE